MIEINGKTYEFDSKTVSNVLEDLSIDPKRVVVEVNYKIISKDKYSDYLLQDGDSVEIVQFVGGG